MNSLIPIVFILAVALALLQVYYCAAGIAMLRSGQFRRVQVGLWSGGVSVALLCVWAVLR